MIDLEELIPRAHQAAKDKGFWDAARHEAECLMLVVSELGEAQEAHRKGRTHLLHAGDKAFLKSFDAAWFQDHIKDTVGDEMADAYIRLCDFAGGYNVRLSGIINHREEEWASFDKMPENFGVMLLASASAVVNIYGEDVSKSESVGIAFATIEYVCQICNIDLATHIELKLQYNATRPYKHAKAY